MLILLFTTASCPNCPSVKKMLHEKNIPFIEIDAGTSGGLALARKHGVATVPTVIVRENQEKTPVARFFGAPEIMKNIDSICLSQASKK